MTHFLVSCCVSYTYPFILSGYIKVFQDVLRGANQVFSDDTVFSVTAVL